MTFRPRYIFALVACVVSAGAVLPSGAAGAVHHCSKTINIPNRLSAMATVLTTRNTSCKHARNVVRRHGKFFAPVNVGQKFSLGGWSCKVYRSLEEDHRARCARSGHRAFRVDYGS
jgi:hypothetical protein